MAGTDPKPSAIVVVELAAPDGEPDAAAIRAGKTALRPLIGEHHGAAVDLPGRRLAVQFSSAFAAVSCAVALQKASRDGAPLRIGVDFGPALTDGETMVGEGVYVASRLQLMAEPGQVYVSGAIHDRVTGRAGLGFEDLGAQSLRDRAEATRVYRIEPEVDDRDPDAAPIATATPPGEGPMQPVMPELDLAGPARSVDAERNVQRGFWHFDRAAPEDNTEAQKLFWAALEHDPQFAPAAAGLALALLQERQHSWGADPGRALIKADALARRAVALAPKYAFGHVVMGEIALFRNDLDKARAELQDALALAPALADAHTLHGLVLLCDGDFPGAIAALERALVRDPGERQQRRALPALAACYYQMQRYEVAERVALRAWTLARDYWLTRQILAAARGQLGYQSAGPILEGIRNAESKLTRRDFASRLYYREPACRLHVEQGLRRAGWIDGS